MTKRSSDPANVRRHFQKLLREPKQNFPKVHERVQITKVQGVYVIYHPRGRVEHVGRTPRAANGISQRIRDHLHGRSSYTREQLEGNGSRLRNGYQFQYLAVADRRPRALLEAFAIGSLCPEHIGIG